MSVHHWLRLLAFPMRTSAFANGQTWDLPVPAQGASTHARFFDPAGPPSLAISCLAVLPSAYETASAPGNSDFVAQWLAYALPCRRFVDVLASGNARLGADVVRYAFIVSDFHRLLLAGLPAHFVSDMPSHADSLRDVSRRRDFPVCDGSVHSRSAPPARSRRRWAGGKSAGPGAAWPRR